MMIKQNLLTITTVFLLAACASSGSRYSISDDVSPDNPIRLDHIEDANPRYEPFSLGGNKDYTLRGNSYKIIKNPQGFKQSGEASWYGKKFHGHLTSNGEIYDMYSMSAAHKTLPIPCYVKVTNKDNGKTAIVRVNDRGPFHPGRIIDLSYAAAYKLDVLHSGVANVDIEYILVEAPATQANKAAQFSGYSIQTASSSHEEKSRTLAQNISQTLALETYIESLGGSFRILVGPFSQYSETTEALQKLKTNGYPQAFIRKTEP